MGESEKIIQAVAARDVLWNLCNKNYKNIKLKAKEWQAISEELGMPIEAVKKKWRCLRDTYARNLTKKRVSGQGAEEEEPAGKYAAEMEFLRDHLKPRVTIGKYTMPSEEEESTPTPTTPIVSVTPELFRFSPIELIENVERASGSTSTSTPQPEFHHAKRRKTAMTEFDKTDTYVMDESEKIIQAVAARDVLWNLCNKNYKNIKLKAKEWQAISEELGMPIEAVKKKWRCLRDTYARNLAKKRVSGQGAEEEEPPRKYAAEMEFLRDHLKPRVTIGKYTMPSEEEESTPTPTTPIVSVTPELFRFSPIETIENVERASGSTSTSTPQPEFHHAKRRKTAMTEVDKTFISTMAAVKEFLVPSSSQSTEDQLFLQSLVQKMASFPVPLRNNTKLEILRYVNTVEQEYLSQENHICCSIRSVVRSESSNRK